MVKLVFFFSIKALLILDSVIAKIIYSDFLANWASGVAPII